jgi:hypothetical protein
MADKLSMTITAGAETAGLKISEELAMSLWQFASDEDLVHKVRDIALTGLLFQRIVVSGENVTTAALAVSDGTTLTE